MWFRRNGRRLAAAIAARFRSLTMFGKITVCVLAMHLALLGFLGIDHLLSAAPKKRTALAVRTHLLPKKTAPKIAPPVQKKRQPVKPARPAKKAIQTETLKKIEKSFAALSTPAVKPSSSNIELPSFVETTPIAVEVGSSSSGFYGPCLIETLQKQLQLPERGEVRARVTLQAPGHLLSLEILDAKSLKNAEWLKNQLPLLELPCFNDFEVSEAKLEFTITFRNAEKI